MEKQIYHKRNDSVWTTQERRWQQDEKNTNQQSQYNNKLHHILEIKFKKSRKQNTIQTIRL